MSSSGRRFCAALVAVMVATMPLPAVIASETGPPVSDTVATSAETPSPASTPAPGGSPLDLDLSSTARNLAAPANASSTLIDVGGTARTITAGDLLTAAELVAVTQVLSSGQQTIHIGELGNALGGIATLPSAATQALNHLTVPTGVTVVHDFATNASLNLSGNLANSGSFFAVTSNPDTAAATISASNILNQSSGLISSVLPGGGLAGFSGLFSVLDLNLIAVHDIINAGTIASSGNLTLAAGGQIVNQGAITAAQTASLMSNIGLIGNSGLIAAMAGNINIASQTVQNMVIQNTMGIMEAFNGAINFRDAAFVDTADLSVLGGNLVAKEINLHSGTGRAFVDVELLTGTLNTRASYANVSTSTPLLSLGSINVTGDPTFYNDAGSISINGDVVVNERLAILASGDVTSTAGLTEITARNGPGQGFDIHIVAGANITTGASPTTTVPGTQATANVTIDGASGTGGDIDFTASPNLQINANSTCLNCDGANVVMAAFAGSGGGRILLPAQAPGQTGSEIHVSGNGTGDNGIVTLIAGATSGTSITTSKITADGSTGPGGGTITITTAQPTTSNGNPITFDTTGTITTGNSFLPGGVIEDASVDVTGNLTASNQISITAGLDITTPEQVVATVASVGSALQGVAVNSAGTFAYVVEMFSGGNVKVIDTTTNTVVASVPVGNLPEGVALNPADTFAYVTNSGSDDVSVIDTATNTVIATVPVGDNPLGVAVTNTFAYVANLSSKDVSVIDTATNTVVATIPTGISAGPFGVAVNPAGTFAYVTRQDGDVVSVIDTATNTVLTTVPVGDGPRGVAVNPAGTFAYVSNQNSDNVSVIDTSTNTVVATVPVGDVPVGVAVNPAGTLAYVFNTGSDNVSVIDTATNTVVATVAAGPSQAGAFTLGQFVTFVGDNVTAYLSNGNAGSVTIVQMPAIVAPEINLASTTGDIRVGTNTGTASLTANTGGSVSITERDAIGIGASIAGGTFFVGAAGSIATTAPITAGQVNFQSTVVDGTLTIGANLTGTNGITLTTIGPDSKVLQTGGQISLPNGNLVLNTPQLGDSASAVNVSSAQPLTFDIPINGNTVTLATTANNASITLNDNVTAVTSATLTTHGSGDVTAPLTLGTTIDVSGAPIGTLILPDGSAAYVLDNTSNLRVLDTATNTIVGSPIPLLSPPRGITFAATVNGNYLYVSEETNQTVAVIDTATNTRVATITPGGKPNGAAAHPSGAFVYVALQLTNSIAVIDTSTNTVVGPLIPVGTQPVGVAVDPTGEFVYVTNVSSNNVSVIATSTNTVVGTLPVGTQPAGIIASPTGRFVYVGNIGSDNVSVIDVTTNTVVGSPIAVGDQPTGQVFDPAGTFLYIFNDGSGTQSVIDTSTNTVVDTLPFNGQIALGYVGDKLTGYLTNGVDLAVMGIGTIAGQAVNLTSASGDIIVATDVGIGGLTASTAGNVTISEKDTLNIGASTVGGTFFLGARGNIATTGAITAGLLNFQSVLLDATLTIGANLTGTNGITLTTIGPDSKVLQTGGQISLPNGNLVLNTPQFGDSSSTINVTSAQSLTFDVPITGNTVSIATTANDGDLIFLQNVTGVTSVNLVANGEGDVLTPNSVAATIPIPGVSVGSVINPDGTFAYVAQNGGTLTVIDTATNTVVGSPIVVGAAPRGMTFAVTLAGTFLYVNSEDENAVYVVDTATNTVVGSPIPVGGGPNGIVATPDGAFVYVANQDTNNVTVIDTATNTVVGSPISVGSGPTGITVDPTGRFVYVANRDSDSVSIIDTSTNTVVGLPIPVGDLPIGVAASPAGTFVYVANFLHDTVSVIDTRTNSVVGAPIAVGDAPTTVAFDPTGTLAYVTNDGSDTVSVINTATHSVIQTINVGDVPGANSSGDFVGIVGDNVVAYIANRGSSDVSVVRLPTIVSPTISLGTTGPGTIRVATNETSGSTLTVNTGGDAYITEIGDVTLGASSVGSDFHLGASGNIATTAAVSASSFLNFQSTLIDGTVTIGANLNGSNGITLTTVGDGARVLQTGGQISLPNGNLVLNTPQLGDSASVIDVTSTQPLTFDVPINGNTVTLATTANDASITLNANVTAVTSATITADGAGDIVTPNVLIGTIDVGSFPQGAVLTPDEEFVYVTNAGSNSVSVIRTSDHTVIETIPVGTQPTGIAIDPSGEFVYVAIQLNNRIDIIRTADNTVVDNVPVGSNPQGVVVDSQGTFVYVANAFSSTVSVIRTSDNTEVAVVPVGAGPGGIAILPNDSFVYVANADGNSVSVIRTSDNQVIQTVPVGSSPFGLAVNPAGSFVYVTNGNDNTVSTIRTSDNTVVATTPVGTSPYSVSVNSAGTLAYVLNLDSNNISIMRTSDNAVIDTISAGTFPFGLSTFTGLIGDNPVAYVPNNGSGTVSVFRMPVIAAPAISLTSTTGDVQVATNAGTTSLTVNTGGGGSVTITERDDVGMGASNVGGTLFVGAAGNITTTAPVTAGLVNFQSSLIDGTLTIGGNLTGTNGITLTTVLGTDSKVLQTGGQISLPNGNLVLNTPQLGNSVSTIDITSAQPLTFNVPINGNTVSLETTANDASITLNANVTAATSTTITAYGDGDVLTPHRISDSVDVGAFQFGTAVNSAGTFAYVTSFSANTVTVIDAVTDTVVASIPVGNGPENVAVNPAGSIVYVTNRTDGTVSVVDASTNLVVDTITVGAQPQGVAFNPAGTVAYVTNSADDTISVIDVSTNSVTATFSAGDFPRAIAVHPEGTHIYVSSTFNNEVLVIDASSFDVVAAVPVGTDPFGLAVNPSGTFVYVANAGSNDITVIDLATNTASATVPVSAGGFPSGVAINPAGTFAYVVVVNGGHLMILDTSTNNTVDTIATGNQSVGVGSFVGFVGDNVKAYIANQNSSTLKVVEMASISSPSLSLTSDTGSIHIGTNAGADSLTANTGGTGSVIITERDDIGVASSSAGSSFNLGAVGTVTTTGTITAGDVLLLRSTSLGGSITIGGAVSALGDLTMNTFGSLAVNAALQGTSTSFLASTLALNSTITSTALAGTFALRGSDLSPLNITGTGMISAPGGIAFVAGLPALTFNTQALTLDGDVTMEACVGFISIGQGMSVNALDNVTIDACGLLNPNGLNVGGTLTINICPDCPGGLAGGTIANSLGDVVLFKNLVINSNGLDVAVIASGNVVSQGSLTLDLSSKTGNGGNLNIFAGVDFDPATFGQVKDASTAFTIEGASSTGGDVSLSNVRINTSSSGAGFDGGNVLIVANAGSQATGAISLQEVNTSSKSGDAGSVTLIGQGGLNVSGSVTASGATQGGEVGLFAAPAVQTGEIIVLNGLVLGDGTFEADCPVCGSLAGISVGGTINTSSTTGGGGTVLLESDASIRVGGSILTSGAGLDGAGDVLIENNAASLFVGRDINMSGVNIGSNTSGDDAGNAGDLFVFGPNFVHIGGKVLAKGGSTKGNGAGGTGGAVEILDAFGTGSVVIGGYIDASGGSSAGGGGGDGGCVCVAAGRVAVMGVSNGVSINASGGAGGVGGAPGLVDITTIAIQSLPTNFDLLSTQATEAALPGGLFFVGESKVVNGTRGAIVNGGDVVPVGTLIREGNSPFNVGDITIDVVDGGVTIEQDGGPLAIAPDNGAGVRTMVTPGQALALYQVSRGQTQHIGLNALGQVVDASPNGGNSRITVDSFDLNNNSPFTVFNLATVGANLVTVNIDGPSAVLDLSKAKTINIAGTLDFIDEGVAAMVELGKASLFVATTGTLQASDQATLVLSGTGSRWTNNGAIRANQITIEHGSASLSLLMGPSAVLGNDLVSGSQGTVLFKVPSLQVTGGQFTDTLVTAEAPDRARDVAINSSFDSMAQIGNMRFGNISLTGDFIAIAPNADVFAASSLSVVSSGQLTVDTGAFLSSGRTMTLTAAGAVDVGSGAATLQSGGNMTITSTGDAVTIGAGSTALASGGNLTVTAVAVIVEQGAKLTAGQLSATAPVSGPLNSKDIVARGSLSIIAGTGGLLVGSTLFDQTQLTSTGGNLQATVFSGPVAIEDGAVFKAEGGNIQMLASGQVTGGEGNLFLARKVGNSGGGIEIGSGLTSSSNLSAAFKLPPGTSPPPGALGTNVNVVNGNGTVGAVVSNTSGGGSVNLSTGGSNPAFLFLSPGGAIVFDAVGAGSAVEFDGGVFATDTLLISAFGSSTGVAGALDEAFEIVETPYGDDDVMAYLLSAELGGAGAIVARDGQHTSRSVSMKLQGGTVLLNPRASMVVDTGVGQIHMRAGAMASIQAGRGFLRVLALSGPGHVTVIAGGRKISLAPGHEAVAADHELTEEESQPADGIGRRDVRTHAIGGGLHALTSEFSISTFLSSAGHAQALRHPVASVERSLRDRLVKIAATVQVARAKGERFTGRPAATRDDEMLVPVRYADRASRVKASAR